MTNVPQGNTVPTGISDPCEEGRHLAAQMCRDGDARDIIDYFLMCQSMDKHGKQASRGLRRTLAAWYARQDPRKVTFVKRKALEHKQLIKMGHVKGTKEGKTDNNEIKYIKYS